MFKLTRFVLVAAAVCGLSGTAIAAPEGSVKYTVNQDDTIYDLARLYMVDGNSADTVVRLNKVKNPRRLAVGSVIEIPRRLLRHKPVDLRVRYFSGPVSLFLNGRSIEPQVGLRVREGGEIETGNNGYISIGGKGRSHVSLPSNSRVRLVDARQYLLNNIVDVQIKVLKGRAEIVAPKLKDQERYRVGTPVAVTAVRGTEFRVSYDPENETAKTEVLEGRVSVANQTEEVMPEAGFGVLATGPGLGESVKLLDAPVLIDAGRVQTEERVSFEIAPVPDARAYRTEIATEGGFLDVIEQLISTEPMAMMGELSDGRYAVRSRAIAENGLEGKANVYFFRRKMLGSKASVETTAWDDTFKFAWVPFGDGNSFAGFQLWPAGDPQTLLVDEIGLSQNDLSLSDLKPGSYNWRVATFQIDDGEVIKVWGPVETVIVPE